MSRPRHVAVIDVGKSNVKLALVELATLAERAVLARPNRVLPGPPWPHFDVEAIEDFLLDALARVHAEHRVDAISVTTHGACAALLDADGALAAPVLDYEHGGPDAVAADYDAIRPSFAETGSPRLPQGLNLGAQLHWQLRENPTLADRVASVVTWPQYWAHRLTGVAATDPTSLGCHTDLWNPRAGRFSSLVDALGLAGRIAPARRCAETLGTLLPALARRTGLPEDTPVACGIHDSNASLLPHLVRRSPPFSVISSGTWVIAMAVGGRETPLDPARDTLINVDAFGRPVPSARFMGGREREIALAGSDTTPDADDVAAVLREGPMLLPSLVAGSGPCPRQEARWHPEEPPVGSARRAAAVPCYLASMSAVALELVGHAGDVVVEGPFARDDVYLGFLAAASGSAVEARPSGTGTSAGAALLFAGDAASGVGQGVGHGEDPATDTREPVSPLAGADGYYRRWRGLAEQRDAVG